MGFYFCEEQYKGKIEYPVSDYDISSLGVLSGLSTEDRLFEAVYLNQEDIDFSQSSFRYKDVYVKENLVGRYILNMDGLKFVYFYFQQGGAFYLLTFSDEEYLRYLDTGKAYVLEQLVTYTGVFAAFLDLVSLNLNLFLSNYTLFSFLLSRDYISELGMDVVDYLLGEVIQSKVVSI